MCLQNRAAERTGAPEAPTTNHSPNAGQQHVTARNHASRPQPARFSTSQRGDTNQTTTTQLQMKERGEKWNENRSNIIYLYSSIYTAHKSQELKPRTMHTKNEYASLIAREIPQHSIPKVPHPVRWLLPRRDIQVNRTVFCGYIQTLPACRPTSRQDLELGLLGGLGCGNLLVHAVDLGLEGARRLGALELESVFGAYVSKQYS